VHQQLLAASAGLNEFVDLLGGDRIETSTSAS
jgi:hypothetical protein